MSNFINKISGAGASDNPAALTWFGIRKELLVRLVLAVVLFCAGLFVPQDSVALILMVLSFLVAGYDVILRAITRIVSERVFGEELVVTVVGLMAFVINAGYEAAAVMIIYQAGVILRAYALELTRGSMRDRIDPYPAEVTVLRGEEEKEPAAPEQVQVDDILIIAPGERFPVDCEVTLGSSTADLSALLGRSCVRDVTEGAEIPAGAVNGEGELRVRATSTYEKSVFARALGFLTDQNNLPSSAETALESYSRVFAPFALGLGILVTLVLLILTDTTTENAIHRALVLLIVACPASMLAPVALTYLAGLYRALQRGVLVKGDAVAESLGRVGAVIFDKDDLISGDEYHVASVNSPRMDPNMLLKVAAHAAVNSRKSEAKAIMNAYEGMIDSSLIQRFEEFDEGILAVIDGIIISMGGPETMTKLGIDLPEMDETDLKTVFLTVNGKYAGCITLSNAVRSDGSAMVAAVESTGSDCVLFSSDSAESTRLAASAVGIREYYSQCMPMDRLEKIQEIKERFPVNSVLYVGHGEADESFLSAADLGVCLNGAASQDALQPGDVVLMDSVADALPYAVEASRAAKKTVRQSLIAILAVKALLLVLSLLGVTYQAWFAAMVDVIIGVAGVLFSARVWDARH
ncbi:MAG: HAD family hydrolase [Oscillospiraceae bacterium]|nr:HAD family hydrolase [Oscillospiraceae bacterium]